MRLQLKGHVWLSRRRLTAAFLEATYRRKEQSVVKKFTTNIQYLGHTEDFALGLKGQDSILAQRICYQ